MANMWLRHKAAVVLAVWYLLLPPLRHDGTVNDFAPWSKWKKLGTYGTFDNCEAALSDLRRRWVGHEPNYPSSANDAICISSDDVRLEER